MGTVISLPFTCVVMPAQLLVCVLLRHSVHIQKGNMAKHFAISIIM